MGEKVGDLPYHASGSLYPISNTRIFLHIVKNM